MPICQKGDSMENNARGLSADRAYFSQPIQDERVLSTESNPETIFSLAGKPNYSAYKAICDIEYK